MSTPGGLNNLLLASAAGGEAGYEIERSLRFNSSDSAYLSRTPASAGNRKTWTWAGWVKRSALGDKFLFSAYIGSGVTDNDYFGLRFLSSDQLRVSGYSTIYRLSSAVFRDASAWYHIVCAVDTTQATATNRIKLWVNGSQITTFTTENNPTPNTDLGVNQAAGHTIGREAGFASYYDGYLADIHFIDGQALDPTSFGETDANGIWQPKAYTGTYGTNGFHLPFDDNSTAAALGTDTSGNGNDWTVNNIATSGNIASVISNGVTNPGNVLDGNTGTEAVFTSTGSTLDVTLSVPVSGITSLEFLLYDGTGSGAGFMQYRVNGSTYIDADFSQTNSNVWNDATSVLAGSPLSSFGFKLISSPNGTAAAVRYTTAQGTFYVSGSLPDQNDSLVDSPTNGTQTDTGVGGEVVGNYCTLNPLANPGLSTLSNGNLDVVTSSTSYGKVNGTIAVSSGKWYWEVVCTVRNADAFIGIEGVVNANTDTYTGGSATGTGWYNGGSIYSNGSGASYGTTYAANDVIGVALDMDAGTLVFYKNGVSAGTAKTGLSGSYTASVSDGAFSGSVNTYVCNFGQRPFAYTAPSGYKALCTANLPTPTIEKGSDYFDTKLYTGNGSTQTISGLDFSPDFVWIKNRAAADSNKLTDTVRGATEELESDTTAVETTNADGLTAFNSDGFDLGDDDEYNTDTETYVAWTWDAGTTTDPANTDGSITSTVRANASAGFSIVTYTGDGAASATIGHGLGVAPQMIIVKNRDVADEGAVYHVGTDATSPENYFLKLFAGANGTAARSDTGAMWNDTAPTSTVFSVGTEDNVNASTEDYVAYCFTGFSGYSSFGSYTGNGSADGPFVYTGFRPRWILIKQSSASGENWLIRDTARDTFNVMGNRLMPSSNNAEDSGAFQIDALSNGFKIRSNSATQNSSSATYIYAAFAENPFALNARAR